MPVISVCMACAKPARYLAQLHWPVLLAIPAVCLVLAVALISGSVGATLLLCMYKLYSNGPQGIQDLLILILAHIVTIYSIFYVFVSTCFTKQPYLDSFQIPGTNITIGSALTMLQTVPLYCVIYHYSFDYGTDDKWAGGDHKVFDGWVVIAFWTSLV